jgi:hypothetical protein
MATATKTPVAKTLLCVDLVLSWKWRCQSKGTVIRGPDLRIAGLPTMFRLSEYGSAEVDCASLRCTCGGDVIPLTPLWWRRLRLFVAFTFADWLHPSGPRIRFIYSHQSPTAIISASPIQPSPSHISSRSDAAASATFTPALCSGPAGGANAGAKSNGVRPEFTLFAILAAGLNPSEFAKLSWTRRMLR